MSRFGTKMTLKQKRAWTGVIFISPWIFGFLLFFAKPLVVSFYYSFQNITIGDTGLNLEFIKFQNFIEAFTIDPNFIPNMFSTIQDIIGHVPVIVIFSLFIAVILNQKFKGRTVSRAIFFLPVIITSGIIIYILKQDVFNNSAAQGSTASYIFKSSGLQDMLINSGLSQGIVTFISSIVNSIFDLTWKSGVQILLFLAGLQTIPRSSYEAADMEGATAWESFWKITFPLISPVILVNIVYTIIDSFTDRGNLMMTMIKDIAFADMRYGYSSAVAWLFFLTIFIIIGIVYLLLSKKIFYMVD